MACSVARVLYILASIAMLLVGTAFLWYGDLYTGLLTATAAVYNLVFEYGELTGRPSVRGIAVDVVISTIIDAALVYGDAYAALAAVSLDVASMIALIGACNGEE